MTMNRPDISPETLYRLPWNLADNAISWLEPTSQCNLYCDGCYRENRKSSHKSLEETKHELEVFKKYRKTDSISIAGGEPLCHPQIVDIVRLVKDMGGQKIRAKDGPLPKLPGFHRARAITLQSGSYKFFSRLCWKF